MLSQNLNGFRATSSIIECLIDAAKLQRFHRPVVTVTGKRVVKSGNEPFHLLAEFGRGLPGSLPEDMSKIGLFIISQFKTYL